MGFYETKYVCLRFYEKISKSILFVLFIEKYYNNMTKTQPKATLYGVDTFYRPQNSLKLYTF